ncbi:hypothetical protein [Frankia sp. Cas3]|uniref:hypothetical protein n=1 Tax=Frankia sp. Cas3 TaxID=3073926 RepID=UPI002AD318CA|nr:hypothetical protein [Frankia sp. Cas3]
MVARPWSFDAARFEEDVLRPVSHGWDPADNLFRCYLLPIDTDDEETITVAADAVQRAINKNTIKGHYTVAARILKHRHKAATETLRHDDARAAHRSQVVTNRRFLAAVLRGELKDLPAVPATFVASLVERFAGRFTMDEVTEILVGLRLSIRDPVALPASRELPREWSELRGALGLLDQATLRSYLLARFPALAVTPAQLADRKTALSKTASGEALTAETTVLGRVKTWQREDQLVGQLRAELVGQLTEAMAFGQAAVQTLIRSSDVAGHLRELDLPDNPDDLAYAIVCVVRFAPTSSVASWRIAYEGCLAARDLRGALALLDAQPHLQPGDDKQRDHLRHQVAEIDERLAHARALEDSDPEAAVGEYQQIAKISHEPDVDEAVRRCRPAPPRQVGATVHEGRVLVRWSPGDAKIGTITYRVLRGVGSPPSWAAGTPMAEDVAETEAVDADPPAGQRLFYTVYTLRDGNPSAEGACTDQGVVILREVTGLEIRGGEGLVEGLWRLPDGAHSARVTRSNDGAAATRITAGSTSFRDVDVRPDLAYEYRVAAEYRLPDGEVRASDGRSGFARTQSRPDPVRDLAVGQDGETLVVSWTPPARGTVQVRVFDRRPDLRPGSVVATTSLRSAGNELTSVLSSGPGELHAAVPSDGRQYWLLPLTVLDDLIAVGQACEMDTRLPPVLGLRAVRLGPTVRLTWQWPKGAPEVVVGWKRGGAPTGLDDSGATYRRYTLATYAQRGVEVPLASGNHTFIVCAAAHASGTPVYGPPAVVQERVRGRARYDVQPLGRRIGARGSRRYRLIVESVDGSSLPPVRLVARSRLAPLDASDGDRVADAVAAADGAARIEQEFDLDQFRNTPRPIVLRVFPAEAGIGTVELVPADPRNLEIG